MYKCKIVLLGEAQVGKTSLVYRFVNDSFSSSYKSTLGVNLLKKDLEVEGYGETSAQIWDLGGQESFSSLRKLYLEGAHGGMLLYDVTNETSFKKLDNWVKSFHEARGEKPLLLIGNKIDLKDRIVVTKEQGEKYAEEYGFEFIQTSAKTGNNVDKAFHDLIKDVLDELASES
ncbi:MAG: GTP-binding protein [Promethearchaeota archaeon]|nr:MAG: GTP-binding protein [Candidatus Lokiarchaeota archaeon]